MPVLLTAGCHQVIGYDLLNGRLQPEQPLGPIPLPVYEAVVRVCGETLHWKSTLRRAMRRAGVSENGFARYEGLSKFVIARSILDDLERVGAKGWRVQRRLVAELASIDRPEAQAPDQQAGREALEDLRRVAVQEDVLLNPEEVERQRRRAEAANRALEVSSKLASRQDLYSQFLALHKETNKQARGFAFERLLSKLFRLYELEYTGSYKTETDQIDGSLVLASFTYLLEARWRADPAADADLGGFTHKVERRLDATRGIFLSMAGFRTEAVQLYRLAKDNKLILVDGQDLTYMLEGRLDLTEGLLEKVRAAAVRGEPYLRLVDL